MDMTRHQRSSGASLLAKPACQGCLQNSARGLILMGGWRDSGFTRVGSQCIEETDVMMKLGTGAVLRLT
jgi:hypothetical protein